MPPGHYRLEVAANGFMKFILENVVVQVTETTGVAATRQIGQVTESVIVHAVTTPVNVTSAATDETISADTATTLPLLPGDFCLRIDTSTPRVEVRSFATPGAMFTELLEPPNVVGLKQSFPMPKLQLGLPPVV